MCSVHGMSIIFVDSFFCVFAIYRYWSLLFFFFQAEDGIRDLVRSRGLGDVYKRQPSQAWQGGGVRQCSRSGGADSGTHCRCDPVGRGPVSYTHLTLPTSDLV